MLRPGEQGLDPVVTVDAAGDTLVYSGPVRDAIARARIVEAFNSVAVVASDSAMPDSAVAPDADRPGSDGDAGRAAREAAVDALARLYDETVEPEVMIVALNLAILDFPPASAVLPPDAGPFIQSAAEVIQRAPEGVVLLVAGYADGESDEDANVALSLERAQAVVAAFEQAGVTPSRLRADARGSRRTEEDGRIGEGHVFFELAPPEVPVEPEDS